MTPLLVGSAWKPKVGETVCGDVGAAAPTARGTLVCLADGLGHGPDARAAAQGACEYVRENAAMALESLMRGVDGALRSLRGAAVSLLSFEPGSQRVQFVGIGNVEVRAVSRSPIAPPTTPGIVGHGLRVVRVWEYPLHEGDLLVLFSDGISSRFDLRTFAHLEPQRVAEAIVAQHHKTHDDAFCLVVRIQTP